MSREPCCILPCRAAGITRYCRLGLTATAGRCRHTSALRKRAVLCARPGPEQLWRQSPAPFGPAPAALCRAVLPRSKLPPCPALQRFGSSSSLLKLTQQQAPCNSPGLVFHTAQSFPQDISSLGHGFAHAARSHVADPPSRLLLLTGLPYPASCCQQAMHDLSFQLPWKQAHSHFKLQIFQPNSLFVFSLYYHLTLFCNRLKVDVGLFGGIYNVGYVQPTYLHALIFGPALRKAIQ